MGVVINFPSTEPQPQHPVDAVEHALVLAEERLTSLLDDLAAGRYDAAEMREHATYARATCWAARTLMLPDVRRIADDRQGAAG